MAFDFYFAGTQCEEANEVMKSLNANVLKSYLNDQKSIPIWFENKHNGWTGKLMIDNGAFTLHRKGGTLDIDKYIAWINEHIDDIDLVIALDDIPGKWGEKKTLEQIQGSAEVTWQNYLYMIERVTQPEKVIPVFHMYENFSFLENMVNSDRLLSNYICISGSKELTNAQREQWYNECFRIIRKSKRPDIHVHCLGSATMMNAEKFPFTSMDATSWIMTGANGGILTDLGVIYVGDGGKSLNAEERKVVEAILAPHNVSLEDIGKDYRKRMCINVHQLYNNSRKCKFVGLNVTRRRLF